MKNPFKVGPLQGVLIADDHAIIRTGLQLILHTELSISSTEEAKSCAEVMSILRSQQPSHLITDMVFKDGNIMEVMPAITSLFPKLNIMVYSMLPADVYEQALRRYHIRYFVSKDTGYKQTAGLLRSFLLEPPGLPEAMQDHADDNPFTRLTNRELEVLHYLLKGETVTVISVKLNLHKNTISTLKARMMEKTDVQNTTELLAKAVAFRITF